MSARVRHDASIQRGRIYLPLCKVEHIMNIVGKPWSVQIGLVEGCNRLCKFCGLNGIRTRPGQDLQFMNDDVKAATAIGLSSLCPTARYEFAMHGEPTLHPRCAEYVRFFRHWLPDAQFQLTTNGKTMLGRMQARTETLFDAGIDIIVLDTYYPERDKLRAETAALKDVFVIDFYEDKKFSPWHNHRRKVCRTIVLMDDLEVHNGEIRSRLILNHAGNNLSYFDKLESPLNLTCTNPFREMAVCHDGDVNICCMDWGHEYVCGNVTVSTAKDIWFGERFEAARRYLHAKNRSFAPCKRCNNGSGSRSGLLPKYNMYTSVDAQVICEVEQSCIPRNDISCM